MKGKIRRFMMVLAAVAFVGSSAMVGYQHYQYHLGEQAYTQAEELAGIPDFTVLVQEPVKPVKIPEPVVPTAQEPEVLPAAPETESEQQEEPVWVDPYADALAAMDFSALREVNGEVLGWILIPDTPVSYPLMLGEDNQKYLNTTWRGSRSSVGSIFLECQNSGDLSDFNTIIYGHRTANRSMFGSLKDYARQEYWQAHPYIYITDDGGCKTYAVFAAYEVGVKELTYRIGFDGEEDRTQFLDFCTAQSVIDTGVTPSADSRVLTLSTCTGTGHETRWVVQAVLV